MTRLNISLILIIASAWTIVLVAWLATIGPLAASTSAAGNDDPPFFYTVSPDDLTRIEISNEGKVQSWYYREDYQRWFFENMEGTPVDLYRWGGITVLLGGPRIARLLTENLENPAVYGLDNPQTIVTLTLRDGSQHTAVLGNATPDGVRNYAAISRTDAEPRLVLVDATWGAVLNRLVNEPPLPTWVYSLDPGSAREVILFDNNEVVRAYGRDRDTGEWFICDIPVRQDPCIGDIPADDEAILANLRHIANHRIFRVEAIDLEKDTDFKPYGTTINSPYARIRVESVREDGITEVTGITLNIGDVTPDGMFRYAVLNETSDVVLVDREWADGILELVRGRLLAEIS